MALAVGIVVLLLWPGGKQDLQGSNPFLRGDLYLRSDSAAAAAVTGLTGRDRALMERLAGVPTAIWLTPESAGPEHVDDYVRAHARQAARRGEIAVFVLYGIPDRDCTGQHSAGGLDADGYGEWIEELGAALVGDPVVIIEPDALASADECGLAEERTSLIRHAVEQLDDRATVYVDAGHSDWIDPARMAQLLQDSGVEQARGFATNVSAYQADADELAYAEQLRAALGSGYYVVDSARNGEGATDQWCNPSGRAVGVEPAAVTDRSALDARLWIKPPGESDGSCGGGPPAGQFWVARALALTRAAGW